MKYFRNGPLPNKFTMIFLMPDKTEFALNKKDALKYLDWCKEQNIEVLGFDVWNISQATEPIVIEKLAITGDAGCCIKEITESENDELAYNIWVNWDE